MLFLTVNIICHVLHEGAELIQYIGLLVCRHILLAEQEAHHST